MANMDYILLGETLATDTNIQMVRGDTLSFGFEYDGTDQELDEAYFTCKKSQSSEQIIFQKALRYGITKDFSVAGVKRYIIRIDPTDTKNVEAGDYYYDFQVKLNGDVFTFLIGALTIKQDIT